MISNLLLTLSAYNKSVVPFCTNDHYSLSKFLTYFSLAPLAIYGNLEVCHDVSTCKRFEWLISIGFTEKCHIMAVGEKASHILEDMLAVS